MLSIQIKPTGENAMDPKLKALLCKLLEKSEDIADADLTAAAESLGVSIATLSAADLPGKLALLVTTADGMSGYVAAQFLVPAP
jgi:hypothetical protein